MKKLIYLFILAIGFTSCSVESMDSTENLLVVDAKATVNLAHDPMGFYTGNNTLKGTVSVWNDCDNLFIQLTRLNGYTPDDIKLGIFPEGTLPDENGVSGQLGYDLSNADNFLWTFNIAGENYDVESSLNIFFGWGNEWIGTQVLGDKNNAPNYHIFAFDLSACVCKDSFSYNDNGDDTYTFTYIPEENIVGAKLSMTFPQANVEAPTGWKQNGNDNSSAWKNEMNLTACTSYSWKFTLTADCNGLGQTDANLWTSFSVDGVAKKGELENITKSCN